MKPLIKAGALAVLTLFVSGCSTYDRSTADWRHPSPIWHPEPWDPGAPHQAFVRVPDATFAGKRFDQLASGSVW